MARTGETWATFRNRQRLYIKVNQWCLLIQVLKDSLASTVVPLIAWSRSEATSKALLTPRILARFCT